MNKKIFIGVIIVLAIAIIFSLLNSREASNEVRVGWQPPWINQGQVAIILQNTEILKENGIDAKFIGFSFGPPMTEAALAGELDVLFLGDQPAFNLISKDNSWKIVAPLVYYRSAVLVPVDSNINSLSDLRGKTIVTGIGSTTYRDTIQILKEAGLKENEFSIKNMDVGEHLSFLESRANKSWNEIDAIAAYDPTVSIAVSKGLAKKVVEYKSLGVIVMNEKFYTENPSIAKKFLESVKAALEYYPSHKEEVNLWYSKATRYTISEELFDEMGSVEPKLQWNNEINIFFNETTFKELEEHLNTSIELGLIKNQINSKDIVVDLNVH